MSDRNHDRHILRRQRQRQYEIDSIIAQYVDAYHSGQSPRIEDFVERYPQYASELLEFAVYYHTVGFATESLAGAPEPTLSPAAEKALARIREQSPAYMPDTPVTIESLMELGDAAGYTPPQLAVAVGLTSALLSRLEMRTIAAASIPRTLFQRLGEALKVAPEAIAAYLSMAQPGQAGGFYYSEQTPAQQQQSFLEAIQSSTLPPERKREWAEIVAEETNSEP
ncbi:MAG TPA: hypothetical protein VFU63_06540 [Ktedonobacterales bacterium]|nr:hypothetical protein [Ktedonobacterales bacterium]